MNFIKIIGEWKNNIILYDELNFFQNGYNFFFWKF